MKLRKNKIFLLLIFAPAITLLATIFIYTQSLHIWQLKLSNFLYTSRPASKDIVIVGVDNDTLAKSNLGQYENWSREVFARAISGISLYGPKAIGIDFFFRTQKEELSDKSLRDSLISAPNPVIIYFSNSQFNEQKGYFVQSSDADPEKYSLPYKFFWDSGNVTVSAAQGTRDLDNIARRMPVLLFNETENKFIENFPIAIVRAFLGDQKLPDQPQISPDQYQLQLSYQSNINIPLEKGEMLINYISKNNSNDNDGFQYVSFKDVYNGSFEKYGKTPEELFKDKIVLIGPTATYFKDIVSTPVHQYPRNGILIHANAIQTILEQKFLRNLTTTEQFLLALLFATASTLVFLYSKIRWSVLYLFATGLVYTFLAKIIFQFGLILDLTHPYVVLIVAFISVYIYRYLAEFKENQATKKALAHFTSPYIAEMAIQNIDHIRYGMERRVVTCLFTDVIHSSQLFEKYGAAQINKVFMDNRQFVGEHLLKNRFNATISKIEGDGIMGFFNAPVDQPDQAIRACEAALRMRQELPLLYKKWQSDPDLPAEFKQNPLDFRIGINTGEVTVGNNGTPETIVYTPTGDAVDVASRLEGANDFFGTRILLGEATKQLLGDQFVLRDLHLVRVKGKTEPTHLYELIGLKTQVKAEHLELLEKFSLALQAYIFRDYPKARELFQKIKSTYPNDGPTNFYLNLAESFSKNPPAADWDGIFNLPNK